MRKILFGLLGLLWAIPSWANCNLLNPSDMVDFTLQENGIVSNTATDTRDKLQMQVLVIFDGTTFQSVISDFISTPGHYSYTFTVPSDAIAVTIKHNGQGRDLRFSSRFRTPGTYTLSFDVLSANPTIVGGIQLQNIKLERGDTATAYTPYDANCVDRCANLYNYSYRNSEHYELVDGNTLKNLATDTANYFSLQIYDVITKESYLYTSTSTPGKYNLKFTVPNVDNSVSIYHSGKSANLGFFTSRKINPGDYVLSFDLLSANPSVVGGLQLKNISLRPAYCSEIQVASTKYTETVFNPLNTALQSAISVVDSVVSRTIAQAASIATLQSGKQTRPANNTECPAYKQCLLVEDEQGVPHWYQITDPFRDFVAPIITNRVSGSSSTYNPGFTQLEYLRSDGSAYINTNYSPTSKTRIEIVAKVDSGAGNVNIVGSGRGTTGVSSDALLVINSLDDSTAEIKFDPAGTWLHAENVNMLEKNKLSLSATEFSVNGDVKLTNNATIPDTDNRPFYIFQRWRPSIESTNNKVQVYEFSIYENDILVRNMIPAKRNSDGAIGMYDTVTKTFFTNAGTGTFTAGPVVANTDVPANPTWTATWVATPSKGIVAGTVYGEGLCNAVAPSSVDGVPATAANLSDSGWNTVGLNCWCRMTGINVDNEFSPVASVLWISNNPFPSNTNCATSCSDRCVSSMRYSAEYLQALFGM